MEYIVFLGFFLLFLIGITVKGLYDARRDRKRFERKLFENYGRLPEREYRLERFARIGSYFRNHEQEGQIDDITWNDLEMDEVFMQMNHTVSSAGEEYLYYTLRTPRKEAWQLRHLEEMIRYFDENDRQRVDVQLLMRRLGTTGDYSLYDYLRFLGGLGKRSNGKHIGALLLLLAFLVMCFLKSTFTVGILGVVAVLIYNFVSYFKEKDEFGPYITSFAYILRLIDVCERMGKLSLPACQAETARIQCHTRAIASIKKGAFLVLSGGNTGTGGNPLEILLDYVRMALHVDIILFNRMLDTLNRHIEDVDALIGDVGAIETAICIGAYRRSVECALENVWCVPSFTKERKLVLEGAYHPLLTQPVKNSIATERGVLLTGSNASGKSTFLKTVALNAILAQTIHTCLADHYEAPISRVVTSMALRDDLTGGESYYIVEIRSLKRILDLADAGETVLCCVDEVLRGTNTVERIAASTQILKSLTGRNLICFAATHDIELTELLRKYYQNYHFEEEIRDGDIFFNYRLLPGKATTRNAIRLLELMGYDEEIIKEAARQAESFVQSGRWESV